MNDGTTFKGYFHLPVAQVHPRTATAAAANPPMLLLHQSPLSSRNYEQVLPVLADPCRPDALGAGNTADGRYQPAANA